MISMPWQISRNMSDQDDEKLIPVSIWQILFLFGGTCAVLCIVKSQVEVLFSREIILDPGFCIFYLWMLFTMLLNC